MKTYKIIKNGNVFNIKKRVAFMFWLTEHHTFAGMDIPLAFYTITKAEQYIENKSKKNTSKPLFIKEVTV